jgi:hypothetical protein
MTDLSKIEFPIVLNSAQSIRPESFIGLSVYWLYHDERKIRVIHPKYWKCMKKFLL